MISASLVPFLEEFEVSEDLQCSIQRWLNFKLAYNIGTSYAICYKRSPYFGQHKTCDGVPRCFQTADESVGRTECLDTVTIKGERGSVHILD